MTHATADLSLPDDVGMAPAHHYRFDLSPAWVPGNPTRPDRLIGDTHSDTEHDHVVELLTRSAARIPGAVYRPSTSCSGTIQLGSGSAQLISNG
ncbi:hypothetical protein ACFT8V_22490 [Streptomyces griseoincarnatus]